jgi:hypothetical protein
MAEHAHAGPQQQLAALQVQAQQLGTADALAAACAATIDPRRLNLGEAEGRVVTRFPPEPSAPIDLGHIKAALVNKVVSCRYQVRRRRRRRRRHRRPQAATQRTSRAPAAPLPPATQGRCILRYDDTNPERCSAAHVERYAEDLAALGLTFDDAATYASDYFEQLYQLAEELIRAGSMYADRTPREQVRWRALLRGAGLALALALPAALASCASQGAEQRPAAASRRPC